MYRRLLRLLIAALFLPGMILAQTCVSTGINGSVINLSCNQTCSDLNFQIPHLKSTTSYTLNTIPYTPYPYTSATGTELTILYADDEFSNIVSIPFDFCFYGTSYQQFVVGSNGLLTFDVSNVAPCNNGYVINPPGIPGSGGGAQCSVAGPYYPRASIMGNFSDLDPRPAASPAGRKIEWRIEGTAPCRKAIVSYYNVGIFGSSCGASFPNTFQMVLHESTGLIEIFTEQKTLCTSSTSQGRSIMGIQDWNWSSFVAVPGRNATQWVTSNEGLRFTPSGGSSRYSISQLYTLSGTLLATADTNTTTAGILDLNFPNVCPGANTTLVVKTTYDNCVSGGPPIVVSDTITINITGTLNASSTSTNTGCGAPSGTITITVPSGTAPYTYVLDAGTPVTGPSPYTFTNVAQGNHTIVVTDATGCTITLTQPVGQSGTLTANATPTSTSCSGASNGTILVTPVGGTAPFTFTLNPGNIVQTGATALFTNLVANTYTISVADAGGCITNPPLTVTVSPGPIFTANVSSTPTVCAGASNGTITVTPNSGTAPFSYSLDGGVPQTGGSPFTFNNVIAGPHSVVVVDAVGCNTGSIPIPVASGPGLTTTITKTDVLCNGGNTGTITVTQPAIGNPPFEYSINGGPWQTNNVFTGLSANTYTVAFREGGGCQGSQTISITEPTVLTASSTTTPVICNGQTNGTITVTASGGIGPYQYSINGGPWQPGNSFQVAANTYIVSIQDANGCSTTNNVNVTEPLVLTAAAILTNATCDGGNNGSITVNANGGNSGYQYALNGGTYQSSNIFNVAPGLYTLTVKDALNCSFSFDTTVLLTSNLQLTPQTDPTICESKSVQLQVSSNATVYSWQPSPSLSNTQIPDPIASPTVTTQYIVTATLGLCSQNDTVMVFVNPAPVPDAGAPGLICYGQTYQLQGTGGVAFTWTPPDFLSSASIANPVSTPPKTITYSLSVIDANGCNSLVTDQVLVEVTPPIKVVTFPYDTVAYPGDTFRLLATSIAPDYTWTPSTGLSDPTIPNPVVTAGNIGDDIVYKVTASNSAGCKGDGYVRVRIYQGPEIYIPTAFSPNNDGKNDKFIPFPVGIKKINYFRVFNRWGQLIYSTSSLNDGWDGKYAGKEQPSGVYVWMAEGVTLDNRVISHTGTVVLIR
jgi:gliding motility-associated-like protein